MKADSFVSGLRKLDPWHIALGIFLLSLTLFLSIRASDEFRWSDWGFGDAQTMLSLRQWEEGGWFSNYFLFAPQGYAKVTRLFDEPQLRHHAHGTCPGSSPRVGPRLLYTHYPAGYLIPYAVLFRLGLDDIFYVRLLSVFFSIGALVLMYIVFSKITSHGIAFVAVFFYGLTPTFLGYSDTLANQPLDDLLRFAFMLAVVLSTRAESSRQRKIWMVSAWLIEFFLSLSSFDSVFFLYVWVIGWDLIDRQGFRWKNYLIYGLAPLSAHSLQFLQNVWYLGFDDAVIDIKDSFLLKNAADAKYNFGQSRLDVIRDTIPILFNNLYTPGSFIAVMISFYIVYASLLKDRSESRMPSLRLLLVLFLCGLSFILILPHAARMPYETRQMIPFAALIASGVTWSFLKEFRYAVHGNQDGTWRDESLLQKGFRPAYLFLSALLLLVFWYQFALNNRQPVYYIPDVVTDAQYANQIESMHKYELLRYRQLRDEVLFAREIKTMPSAYEPVFFSVGGFRLFWDPTYVPGYPQIMPITEYYTGSRPVLCFDSAEALAYDLIYMIRRSPYRFSPVLLAKDQASVDRVLSILLSEKVLGSLPANNYSIMGRSVTDLTYYLRWGQG